jgi:hypothetical protein
MSSELFNLLGDAFRDVFAAIPAPIAPQSHADACLCEACECCADPSCDVPVEARGVAR